MPLLELGHAAESEHVRAQASALRETQLERMMADFEPHLQNAALAVTAWLSLMDALLVSCRQDWWPHATLQAAASCTVLP